MKLMTGDIFNTSKDPNLNKVSRFYNSIYLQCWAELDLYNRESTFVSLCVAKITFMYKRLIQIISFELRLVPSSFSIDLTWFNLLSRTKPIRMWWTSKIGSNSFILVADIVIIMIIMMMIEIDRRASPQKSMQYFIYMPHQ